MTWEDLKAIRIPVWEVIGAATVLVAITWAAFAWADELKDKQVKTQDQLDQLIVIVTTSTVQNNETHEEQDDALLSVSHAFDLLVQEMEIRRELEEEDGED